MDTNLFSIDTVIAGGLLAFAIAFFLSRRLARAFALPGLLDHPNTRSLHQRPIPRTGGLAMLAGMMIGMSPTVFATTDPPLRAFGPVFAGLAPLALVALVDDRQGVAARWRILVHLLAAVSLLAAGLAPDRFELPGLAWPIPVWATIPLTLLFIVWMINLYNFMDGMDGFAGGMAVIGFATLAWLGRADGGFATLCLTAAAASAGFLVHNFPPAKLFLGDTGSTTLGFLAAACGLWGSKVGLFPFWVALLVFSPFITDATVTLMSRLLRGEKVWEAHRTHCYQRLVLLGWGHRRTVLVEYALMLACAGSALLAVRLPPTGQVALTVGWIVVYGLLMGCVEWLERRHVALAPPVQ
ncbi:MAG: glycosyltransferase family 4 protein [Candidatus Contendobacter sp.]|nr:glycosyltransferase family 4 protein [Candidatus Contendobacter sp.]MDS4058237.1 glycosyltransferase family 4 protein [Candidatus Contendobacter sp.]